MTRHQPRPADPYGDLPVNPGRILREEFMQPLGISRNALARALQVPVTRINDICAGSRAITIDTALRLARYLGTTPEFWMHLQASYDLVRAEDSQARIRRIVHPLVMAVI